MAIRWVLWAVLAFACAEASALEIYRNGAPYNIVVRLPDGADFENEGIDRTFNIEGVKGILRLIQDTQSDCSQLVSERSANKAKDGFEQISSKIGSSECSIKIRNEATSEAISSFYIWMTNCSCYAALHVWEAPEQKTLRNKILQSLLDQLRVESGTSNAAQQAGSDDTAPADAVKKIVSTGGAASDKQATSMQPENNAAQYVRRNGVTIKLENRSSKSLQLEFYAANGSGAWPGRDKAYNFSPHSEVKEFNLNCDQGEKICIGGWERFGDNTYWGVGRNNTESCVGCCFACGNGLYSFNLTN